MSCLGWDLNLHLRQMVTNWATWAVTQPNQSKASRQTIQQLQLCMHTSRMSTCFIVLYIHDVCIIYVCVLNRAMAEEGEKLASKIGPVSLHTQYHVLVYMYHMHVVHFCNITIRDLTKHLTMCFSIISDAERPPYLPSEGPSILNVVCFTLFPILYISHLLPHRLYQTLNWHWRNIQMQNLNSWYEIEHIVFSNSSRNCNCLITGILPQSKGDGWWRVWSSCESSLNTATCILFQSPIFLF